jgi:hypothetical protein
MKKIKLNKKETHALTFNLGDKTIIKSKRAELTTQQLVVLIILIISFVIILFLLFRMNLRTETNKEICHNSVVLLSKKSGLFGALDCKTSYVCFTIGGKCTSFNYDYEKKISFEKENLEEEIKTALNEEFDDCWWMFGEGKIDYTGVVDYEGYKCAICSAIKFDNRIQDSLPQINFNNQILETKEKYLVITGMNKETGKDDYLNSTLVKSGDINLMSPSCKEFVTKA